MIYFSETAWSGASAKGGFRQWKVHSLKYYTF